MSPRGKRQLSTVAVGLGTAALAITMSGCSQVTGLAGGTPDAVFVVQIAAVDAVMKAGIGIQQAPVCGVSNGTEIACTNGKTTAGDVITVTVSGTTERSAKVSIGERVVLDGPVEEFAIEQGRVDK